MISLIMPPKDQVSLKTERRQIWRMGQCSRQTAIGSSLMVQVARVQKMLGDELGTASNIKSRVNRQSVLGAITSAQQRLKLYNKVGCICQHSHGCQSQDTMKQRGGDHLVMTVPVMQVPPNGLVIYTGTIVTDDGKEKKLNIDFEPFKPINTSLYLCDNKFHTEALNELLESDQK